jgi:hypothetical protein
MPIALAPMPELREIKSQTQEANESAVRILRKLLDEAESGKIETVCFDKGDMYFVDCSLSMNTTLKLGSLDRIKAALLSEEE